MNKDIFQEYNKRYKANIAIALALMMLAGFFVSRAMLSVSIVAFGANALIGVHPKVWLKSKWWLLGCAWVGLYTLSGVWSDDWGQVAYGFSSKLPILLLPLAFSLLPAFTRYQLKVFTILATMLYLGSIGYSLYFLITDPDYYIEQYRFSKVLPTLAGKDYIRYSLSISLFIIWCIYVWGKLQNKAAKWFVGITIVLLILHLHIVAVKTGILVFYVFIVLISIYITVRKRSIIGVALLAVMAISAVSAYKYVPTFSNKIDYFRYSIKIFKQNNADVNYSDIGRLVSYNVALNIMEDNWLTGVGVGDMRAEMHNGYKRLYPHVPENMRLKPHNQFLVVAVCCGLPVMLLFLYWVIYPVRWVRKGRDGFFVFATWFVMFIPMMVEPFLELQLGVYVYLFFILMISHNLNANKAAIE